MTKVLAILAAAVLAAGACGGAPALAAEKTYNVTISPVPAGKRAPVAYVGPLLVFKASVAGREVWAVVDTTAPKTAMDLGLARELRLKLSDEGAANVAVAVPGQFTTRYERLPTLDLSQAAGAAANRKIGFVLGQDFLRGAALAVDPSRQTFELGPSGTSAPAGSAVLDLARSQLTLTIGAEPVRLRIDTSFNGQLALNPAVFARLVPKGAAKLAELDLGPVSISNVAVVEAPPVGEFNEGAVGLGLLNQFLFGLDLGDRKLWIAPLPARR